jgi:hypothetical protein
MSFVFRLLKTLRGGGRDIQHDDTDEVFPAHYLDQLGIISTSFISLTFQFKDVLDPQKLHDSLVKLLEMEGWKKLGGRLRRDVRYRKPFQDLKS